MTPRLIVVMGPSGCGKSHIGAQLAAALKSPFIEGDDFHPPENRGKMARGKPLIDTDRAAWLDGIESHLSQERAETVVLACSALTQYVQDRLRRVQGRKTHFILLDAPHGLLAERLEKRQGHFMPVSLLDSQLDALRAPTDATRIHAQQDPGAIVAQIIATLEQSD